MRGKEYTQKQAAAFAALAYQAAALNTTTANSPFFIGHLSSDRTTVSDPQNNVYFLSYTGNPKEFDICQKTSIDTAICIGSNVTQIFVDGVLNAGLVLASDSIGFYLRKLGGQPFYLPTTPEFVAIFGNTTPTDCQSLISSDGNAVVIGTVIQNQHTLANGATALFDSTVSGFHQEALYCVATGFQFGTVATLATTTDTSFLKNLTYPEAAVNIVWCKHFLEELIDLNTYANGNVPAPDPGITGSQSLWYPKATKHSGSAFTQFNPITNYKWDADSGYQFIQTEFLICQYDFSGQKKTLGNQNQTWAASPNYAVFNSFQYSINNSYNTQTKTTQYNVDLISTFVNGYLFTMNNTNWTESFFFKYDALQSGANCSCAGNGYGTSNGFNELLNFDYTYEYDTDVVYKLRFLETPSVWVTTATVNITTQNPAWQKFFNGNSYQTGAGGFCPDVPYNLPDPSDGSYWDAYCSETRSISDTKTPPGNCYVGGFQAGHGSAFAYSSSFTLGPPFIDAFGNALPLYADVGFGSGGSGTVTQYSGSVKRGSFDGFGGSWPGFYLAYYTGPAEFNYVDLNYDQVFLGTQANYSVIYGGRSTMVMNNLNTTTPTLYGIVTQLLGDGTDTNVMESAFKGRLYDPDNTNTNTAFVYNRTYDGIYRYSAPWLFQGNLTGIGGQTSNTSSSTAQGLELAVADLIDYGSLMDAYGNQQAVTDITNLINQFQAALANPNLAPAAATINNVIAEIIATDPDLTAAANGLGIELINAAANASAGDLIAIQPDMIGTKLPDVYTDKIFSFSATFPFQPFGTDKQGNIVVFNRFLKAVDSWLVQEYYIDTINNREVIRGFNVADGTNPQIPVGETSLGKVASVTYKPIQGEKLLDFVLTLSPTATQT